MWLVYLALPVGFLIAAVRLIHVSILLYTKDDEQKESEVNTII